jgi:pimeloyl-ACP methyl ester carboxylesterase
MSVIVLNRSVIHYESLGRGRPVLFLHTWVGSWRYWVPSLQVAAVSHSAYALDFYGFGESARDPSAYTIESQAALVGSFMDEMGIDRAALVGHGLGALVGLRFAGENPERIARILAVGLPLEEAPSTLDLRALGPDKLMTLLDSKGLNAGELLPETHMIDPGALQLVPESGQIRRSISAMQLAGISILIVNGAADPLLTPRAPAGLPGFDTHVHEIVIPATGHFPMLEAADTFHRLMIDFLALEPGVSPRELRLKEEWRRRVR